MTIQDLNDKFLNNITKYDKCFKNLGDLMYRAKEYYYRYLLSLIQFESTKNRKYLCDSYIFESRYHKLMQCLNRLYEHLSRAKYFQCLGEEYIRNTEESFKQYLGFKNYIEILDIDINRLECCNEKINLPEKVDIDKIDSEYDKLVCEWLADDFEMAKDKKDVYDLIGFRCGSPGCP